MLCTEWHCSKPWKQNYFHMRVWGSGQSLFKNKLHLQAVLNPEPSTRTIWFSMAWSLSRTSAMTSHTLEHLHPQTFNLQPLNAQQFTLYTILSGISWTKLLKPESSTLDPNLLNPKHDMTKLMQNVLIDKFRRSTPPQNRLFNVLIGKIQHQVDNFVGEMTFWID